MCSCVLNLRKNCTIYISFLGILPYFRFNLVSISFFGILHCLKAKLLYFHFFLVNFTLFKGKLALFPYLSWEFYLFKRESCVISIFYLGILPCLKSKLCYFHLFLFNFTFFKGKLGLLPYFSWAFYLV